MQAPSDKDSPPQTLWDIMVRALDAIRALLPPGWRLEDTVEPGFGVDRGFDAICRLMAPDGSEVDLIIQAKRSLEARDVPLLENDLTRLEAEAPVRATGALVAAQYLSATVRQRLAEQGLNYADATGNLYLSLSRPALFLRDAGAVRNPWRGPGRPRDSFRGGIAARVVRALADFTPPMTVPQLIKRSKVSTGAGYRVVDFLERQALLEHKKHGPITWVDWRPMLQRWAEDYEPSLEQSTLGFLAPRGVETALEGLGGVDEKSYVLTGSFAAGYFEAYAKPRLAWIYATNPERLAGQLGLRSVETGANVLLMQPPDEVVFERGQIRQGLQIAAPSQIAVDLLNGPGRAPAEADALLDWMERNESAWRS
jgi:Transcriptional regulator, AbiEi antitoxin, Type IV TA system